MSWICRILRTASVLLLLAALFLVPALVLSGGELLPEFTRLTPSTVQINHFICDAAAKEPDALAGYFCFQRLIFHIGQISRFSAFHITQIDVSFLMEKIHGVDELLTLNPLRF